jgi:hypothetical protein
MNPLLIVIGVETIVMAIALVAVLVALARPRATTREQGGQRLS